jgi:ABC-type branched-subunit amino acid transport system substrate-binding protein
VKLVYVVSDAKTPARIMKAAAQQGWKPLFVTVQAGYDPVLLQLAGDAANGAVVISFNAMFLGEDAAAVPEIRLMQQWAHKVRPGYNYDLYTAVAWAHARMFFKALASAGVNPTRGSLMAELQKITTWDSFGMFPEVGPATKRPTTCYLMITVDAGNFRRLAPAHGFQCQPGGYFKRP